MPHASIILLQSSILDNQSIINRYLSVADDVLRQLQKLKIDVAVTAIVKNIPDYAKLDLIDNLISLCSLNRKDGTSADFDTYTREILAQFSINERFCILAHTNLLSSIDKTTIEDIDSLLSMHFYEVIHDTLVHGNDNGGASCQI